MSEIEIVLNQVQCLNCGDIIQSHHRHDFKTCNCGSLTVDGGSDYIRRLGNHSDYLEMTVYSDAPFTEIREALHRGSRGVSGKEPLKWIPLCEIDDVYLDNLIAWQYSLGYDQQFVSKMYIKEKEWRGLQNK